MAHMEKKFAMVSRQFGRSWADMVPELLRLQEFKTKDLD